MPKTFYRFSRSRFKAKLKSNTIDEIMHDIVCNKSWRMNWVSASMEENYCCWKNQYWISGIFFWNCIEHSYRSVLLTRAIKTAINRDYGSSEQINKLVLKFSLFRHLFTDENYTLSLAANDVTTSDELLLNKKIILYISSIKCIIIYSPDKKSSRV